MNSKQVKFIIFGLIVFIFGGICGIGASKIYSDRGVFSLGNKKLSGSEYQEFKDMKKRYEKAEKLIALIKRYYYQDVKDEDINEGIYKGIFAGLGDKYSSYMTKKEYAFYETAVAGEFEGIGVTVTENKNRQIEIINTIKDSPAEKEGLKKGDIIKKVDGKRYGELDKAVMAMRGRQGTTVQLVVLRKNKYLEFNVRRAKIVNNTVTEKILEGNIGYIEITAFENKTAEAFTGALERMEKKGVKGLIVDLRDNGGGLVNAGVGVADKLLGKGLITFTKDKYGNKQYYKSDAGKTRLPYVVLVNENTASASEIISAAIKDLGPGKIVGVRTYGKGVIQISQPVGDGSGLKLTIMQYFSPKGNVIHKKGVKPDYEVKGRQNQLKKAIQLLK